MDIQLCCDNLVVLNLQPEPYVRGQIDNALRIIEEGNAGDMIIDFSEVGIINSLSLSGLLQLRKHLKETGQKLILCNISPMTKKIFNITCLDTNFEFASDKEAAISRLAKK